MIVAIRYVLYIVELGGTLDLLFEPYYFWTQKGLKYVHVGILSYPMLVNHA